MDHVIGFSNHRKLRKGEKEETIITWAPLSTRYDVTSDLIQKVTSDCKADGKDSENENRRTPPSIPSKYDVPRANETESSNAFGTRTCRFKNVSEVTPGPGAYYKAATTAYDSAISRPAVSLHGYTSMISKTPRFERCHNSDTPGPGAYVVTTNIAAPVGIANSHFFAKPYCAKRSIGMKVTPGPGHYDIKGIYKRLVGSASFGSSAFMSTERSLMGAASVNGISTASVGSYDVAKSLDTLQKYGRDDRRGKPFPSASFASSCKRLSDVNPATITPGPGYYFRAGIESHEKIPRAHAIIRVSLRHQRKPSKPVESSSDTPGPGWYFSECENIKSKGITSVFKSNLPRFRNKQMPTAPGPAYYRPKLIEKKTVLMNKDHRWV